MPDPSIDPSSITKPIQLLGAWLVGLILTNTAFLTAAAKIKTPTWVPGVLTIAAIFNVPLFLACLFLLQTHFRPELQEDAYYSRYLEARYSTQTGKAEIVEVAQNGRRPVATPTAIAATAPLLSAPPGSGVDINDLLPRYLDILAKFQERGIPVSNKFGSASSNPHTPAKFVVTFTRDFPVETVQAVIRICLDYGLDGLHLDEPTIFPKRLYVGSFVIDGSRNVSDIDRNQLLRAGISMDELIKLVAVK